LRKDGSLFYASGTLRPLEDESNVIQGFIKVCRDITERQQSEQKQTALLERERAARAEADRANELKLQFLAVISHELRTPLTSIKGFASTLMATDVNWDDATRQQFISIIEAESDKLIDLVEQLLDISRIQAGRLRISPMPQTMSEIVELAQAQLNELTKDHLLTINVSDQLPLVVADRQRIAQVLVNLVGNSAKYSPPHTHITLQSAQSQEWVQVDVIDEGYGIDPEKRDTIFDLFVQVDDQSRRQKGAGLGLAICKGIIEQHGGEIWIKEQSTPGTTFSFTLPVATT
jgi:signal transduction histidine kinase